MTTTIRTGTIRTMDPLRRTAFAAGVLYLATFVTSIPALGLYADVLDDPAAFLSGAGGTTPVLLGGFLELLCALTGIGTAVVLYRVVRRVDPAAAVGFVASRTYEAAMIVVGVVAVLSIVTLRQDGVVDAVDVGATVDALVAVKDWTFLFGPGVAASVNALCLATVMYRSRLVPRWIPTLGLIGAPVLALSSTLTLFGVFDQTSSVAMVMVLPIAVWEFSLGVRLAVKGFDRSAARIDRPVDADVDALFAGEPVAV